jgi:hypothetical protein
MSFKRYSNSDGQPCHFYKLMAFVIPFLAITLAGVLCRNHSWLLAPTMGFMAGASGFGLYSAIKFILHTIRGMSKRTELRLKLERNVQANRTPLEA